jgi:3-hydroxybutyryl-CoA dehydratase
VSAHNQFDLYPGMQETFSKVMIEGEAALFANLLGNSQPDSITPLLTAEAILAQPTVHSLLLVGMIGGLLHTQIPGYGSQCVTMQFEFLGPVSCGDQIDTVIQLTDLDPAKHLATFRTDCYNQEKNQVITGQAVMFIPNQCG